MKNDWGKENYLVLDWSIDSLEDRYKYLEENGILEDLSDRRKSNFAEVQLNMITTYLFRSRDVESGRKVDESYYIDESSYLRSLKNSTRMDNKDRIDDDEEYNGDLDLDNELETYLDLETESSYEEHDDTGRYINSIEDEQDAYHERLLYIENLFDSKNIDHTVLRRVVTTYRDIKDIEFDSDIIKYNVVKIMESVLMCTDSEDDNEVIELLMRNMTEREISSIMNVSHQSVNKRIKKIFRKTIKFLNS